MENEEKKKVVFPKYHTQKELLVGSVEYRGENLMIISEVYDYTTGELIKEEYKPVYEKYVDHTIKRMIRLYNDDLQYHPEGSNIMIVCKKIKPGMADDLFSVKTAKGKTRREVIDLR